MGATWEVILAAILVFAAPMAGCIGQDDDAPVEPASSTDTSTVDSAASGASDLVDGQDEPAPGAAPQWTHGDHWTYNINFDLGFGELLGDQTTLVLHATQGGYSVAAADRNAAIVDQYFDQFFVGQLDTDLNPVDQDGGFQMFDFPLEDGKTWTTQVTTQNGSADLAMTVSKGPGATFEIVGEADGASVAYTYSPQAQWITSYTFTATDFNGEQRPLLQMELMDNGANFTGTFTVLDMEEIYFRSAFGAPVPQGGTVPPVDTINVPEGYTFVQRIVAIFGFDFGPPTAGAHRVDMTDPEGQQSTFQQVGGGQLVEILTDEPPVTGDWQVSYAGLGSNVAVVFFAGFTEEIVEFTSESHAHHG